MRQKFCAVDSQKKYSGLLIPLMKKWLNTDTKKGFESMNQALKIQAENIT